MPKKRTPFSLPRTRKQFIPWLIATILLLAVGASQLDPSAAPKLINVQPGYYRVVEFFDGDTIAVDMNGANEKIRLIGVDTPETHDPRKSVQCYGKEASEFTKNLIGNNPVRLEADPTNQNRDRYNRLLRYVYLPDGRLVNGELIKQGYGFAYTSFPFQKLEEFREFQRQAQEQSQGLWSTCEPQTNDFGGYTSNDL
jgi:micrococcal nuclease